MKSEFKTKHLQPSIRAVSTWSPPKVRRAMRSLQDGAFAEAAQLFDAIMADDRAQPVLSTRTRGVLGLPLDFEPADKSQAAASAVETLREDWWDIFPEDDLDELQTYGLGVGAAVAQVVWERKRGRWVPGLEIWHPSLQRYSEYEDRWYALTQDGEVVIEPGGGKWLLYTPYGKRRYWLKALVRSMAIPWLAKYYAITDWQRFSENLGGGVKKVTHPTGASEDAVEKFLSDVADLASQGLLLMPEGWNADLMMASVHNAEAFEKLIGWADTAMSITALGQNLTTDVSGGSYAAANVHNQVRLDLLESDTEGLSTTTHDQVLEPWAEFNLGSRDLAPWPKWDTTPPPEDGKIYEYHLKTPLIRKNELRAKIGLPPLDKKDGGDEFVVIQENPQEGSREIDDPTMRQMLADGRLIKTSRGYVDNILAGGTARLSSGDNTRQADGFVEGQLYADAVADRAAESAQSALAADLERVRTAIASAEDYEGLRAALLSLYGDMTPEALADVTEKALILADLAGRLSARNEGGSPQVSATPAEPSPAGNLRGS